MNRRGFVGAAAVGVGAAWVAPAVISMPASGSSNLVNSPPPGSTTTTQATSTSTTTTTPTTSSTTQPATTTTEPDGRQPTTVEQPPPSEPPTGPSEGLPRTGIDLQDPLTLAFGLIATGGALQVWSAQRERLEAAALEANPPIDPPPGA